MIFLRKNGFFERKKQNLKCFVNCCKVAEIVRQIFLRARDCFEKNRREA